MFLGKDIGIGLPDHLLRINEHAAEARTATYDIREFVY